MNNYTKQLSVSAILILSAALLAWSVAFGTGVAFAQGGSGGGSSGGGANSAAMGDQDRDRDQVRDPSTHDGDEPIQDRDQIRDQDRDRIQDPTTHTGDEPIQDRLQDRDRIRLDGVATVTPAGNGNQLRIMIQAREQELNREASSSAPLIQNIFMHQNRIRLAVHALYASENLLGPVGPRVSQVARQVESTVQTTANIESQMQERSYLANLFFGGDRDRAQMLLREVEANRERIQEMKNLVDQGDISAEVRAMLMEQIRLMEEEQERMRVLAQDENDRWGIFSWRF